MPSIEDAGGGIVRRGFDRAGERVPPGTRLSSDDLRAMSGPNLKSLVDSRYIELFPADPAAKQQIEALQDRIRELEAGPVKPGQRHVIHRGAGNYDVIEGKRLNTEPLDKAAAEALAAG